MFIYLLGGRNGRISSDLSLVEPGKPAYLIIVNGDPLTNTRDALNVEQVVRKGGLLIIDALLKQP